MAGGKWLHHRHILRRVHPHCTWQWVWLGGAWDEHKRQLGGAEISSLRAAVDMAVDAGAAQVEEEADTQLPAKEACGAQRCNPTR